MFFDRYHHFCFGVLAVSTCALLVIACGDAGSYDGGSTSASGTGPGAGASAGTGGNATGGGGGGTLASGGATGGGGGSGTAGGGASTGTGASGGSGGGGGSTLPVPPYLVSIDHWASPSRLLKIDVQTGAGKEVCELPADVDDVNYHSLTFDQNGILYLSNSMTGTLDILDPCTCEVTHPWPPAQGVGGVPGISSNQNGHIYGIEITGNKLVDFDFMNGGWAPIANLNAGFTSTGAGWSNTLYGGMGGLWAINGQDNSLRTIKLDGTVDYVSTIGMISFAQSVGVEMHPANGAIYACTTDTVLYQIDPDGIVPPQPIGNGMGHTKTCNNLAAPWVPIACLDDF